MFLPPLGRPRRKLQVHETAEEYQAIFEPFRIELSITLARSLLALAFGSWCFCHARYLLTIGGSGTPKRQSLTALAMLLHLAAELRQTPA